MFHVGQLVVCVDDKPHLEWPSNAGITRWSLSGLQHGTVYTVRDTGSVSRDGTTDTIRLAEIVRTSRVHGDYPFKARRFRPVDETRLTIFRQHLAPLPSKQTEEA